MNSGQSLKSDPEPSIQIAAVERSSPALVSSVALVIVIGFAFSFLPYLLWWHSLGHFAYIADKDNQYFLQLASRLYYGNLLSMSDVVVLHGTTAYQALQFVPAVWLARMLGLGVLEVNALWHLWAAIALPLTFYLVFFHWLRRPWAAAFCTIVMLVDCGVLTAEPLFMQALRLYQAAVGHLPAMSDGQELLGQWRVTDPAVGMPLVLLQIFFVSSAVERPQDRKLLAAAGISTAVMFYVWFYYWTAVVGALAIAFVLDRPARRVYAAILGIGLVAGLPAVVDGFATRSLLNAEALDRIGVFAPVPRLGFFLLPKVALIALLVTGVWIWRKPNRQGLYLWCLAIAALLLANNHIVTGMDLRAGHWRYVWGIGLSMLVLVMVAQLSLERWRASRRNAVMIAAALLLFEVAGGAALRVIEVDRAVNTRLMLNRYGKLESSSLNLTQVLPVNAVIAGDEDFCALASIVSGARPLAGYAAFLSLDIGDREWESRQALNAHLEGLSFQEFQAQANEAGRLYGWNESADRQKGAMVAAAMMQEFARMDTDLRPEVEALGVAYIAISATRPDPDYLKRGWSMIESGRYWRIWKKD